MARAIIRWSVSGEKSNTTGNEIRSLLEDDGFRRVGTAAMDTTGQDIRDVLQSVQGALEVMKAPLEVRGVLDHVWVYIDGEDG